MKNRRKSNLFGCLHEFRQFFFITLLSVLSVNLYAQQRGIQGVVVDGNGETIIGANVLSEDGKAGVITDLMVISNWMSRWVLTLRFHTLVIRPRY